MSPILISGVTDAVKAVIDRLFPDAEKSAAAKAQAELELHRLEQAGELAALELAVQVITAEAGGESWLQRNWRPIVMLTFAGLITARWLGLSAPGIDAALELKLFEIVQLGLGGYVIGRSAEKVVREWKRPA